VITHEYCGYAEIIKLDNPAFTRSPCANNHCDSVRFIRY